MKGMLDCCFQARSAGDAPINRHVRVYWSMASHLNCDGVDRDPFAREALKTLQEVIRHFDIQLTKALSESVQDTH